MKTTFVESLTATTGKVVDFFQVAQVDRRTRKEGGAYLALKVRDRTGEVGGNLWDVPADLELKTGDVVKVEAETQTYRGNLQLKFVRVRLAKPEEVCKDDYMPASKHDREALLRSLVANITRVSRLELRRMLIDFVSSEPRFKDAPAATKNHQAYLGGLLEHVINLTDLAIQVCKIYPALDLDILIAGCVLHDIGKLDEYCYDTHIDRTRAGRLLGHIVQGVPMVQQFAKAYDIPAEAMDHICHIMVSHHGRKEWGAAVEPLSREAQVFHMLDMIDSRMGLIDNIVAAGEVDQDGFTARNQSLGTAVWVPRG
jgi:3'-5' exoribonuclease